MPVTGDPGIELVGNNRIAEITDFCGNRLQILLVYALRKK